MRWLGPIPVPVLVRDTLPRAKDGTEFAGYCYGPVIAVRRGCEADEGLVRHELEHVRQWWTSLGAHWLLYPLSRRYRLWAEMRAHAVGGQAFDPNRY